MKRGSWAVLLLVVGLIVVPSALAPPADDDEPEPAPTPEPTPTPSIDERRAQDVQRIQQAIWREINERRDERDLRQLYMDDEQRELAKRHSEDMLAEGYYNHTAPDGERFMPACRPSAEVIMKDSMEPAGAAKDVVDAWMNSPEHREILLDPRWSTIGVGVALHRGGDELASANFC